MPSKFFLQRNNIYNSLFQRVRLSVDKYQLLLPFSNEHLVAFYVKKMYSPLDLDLLSRRRPHPDVTSCLKRLIPEPVGIPLVNF